jgi:hypothetical protein
MFVLMAHIQNALSFLRRQLVGWNRPYGLRASISGDATCFCPAQPDKLVSTALRLRKLFRSAQWFFGDPIR